MILSHHITGLSLRHCMQHLIQNFKVILQKIKIAKNNKNCQMNVDIMRNFEFDFERVKLI